jgi:hypothetical protein
MRSSSIFFQMSRQGTLTEGEDSVHLTSLFFYFRSAAFIFENIFTSKKTGYLNEEVNRTDPFPLVRVPWPRVLTISISVSFIPFVDYPSLLPPSVSTFLSPSPTHRRNKLERLSFERTIGLLAAKGAVYPSGASDSSPSCHSHKE